MRRDPKSAGKAGLELIEEATHLLRTAQASALLSYYLGTLPFVLGLLYFWADMSRSPFAARHLADAALGMAGLFIWMKFWQALFLRSLKGTLLGTVLPRLTLKQGASILVSQMALQPTGLFLLPLAFVLTLPLGWTCAFYQNLTALADAQPGHLRLLVRRAVRQSVLWPGQNHSLLLVLGGFGFFVFLNWGIVCFLLPKLVKMLLGIESVFTRHELGMLNTTFLAAVSGLTYLCVDPILKACYVLRCFYGESLRTGEDLRAELGRLSLLGPAQASVLAFLALAVAGQAAPLPADTPFARPAADSGTLLAEASAPAPGVAPGDLERAIQEVAQQPKYAWRMPRTKAPELDSERGVLGRFLERTSQMVQRWLKRAADWVVGWLDKLLRSRLQPSRSGAGYGWIFAKEILVYGLVLLAVAGLVYVLYSVWRKRRRQAPAVPSEPISLMPDLGDENVGPEQMPEDSWTKLGQELLARGELRLALRAFLLASLAHLAARSLIRLAKFKSNRDYERELQRRGHSFPELLAVFGENVAVFDRAWYGLHELDLTAVNQFAANVDRLRSGA